MINKGKSIGLKAMAVAIAAFWSSSTLADFTVHYRLNSVTGIPQSLPGVASESLPTSLSDAIQDDFFFIFDSFYEDDNGNWHGDLVRLQATTFFFPINADCRLQLGGYLYQDGSNPKTVNIAVTHHRITKDTPPGWPEDPDDICFDNPPTVRVFHNNGVGTGAWTASASAAAVNSGSFSDFFYNVQVAPQGINCSSAGSNSGQIAVDYDENPVGDRVTFDFNANITPTNGILMTCAVDGTLYSVWGKEMINSPNHTPIAPNPSPLSRGVVDHIRNP